MPSPRSRVQLPLRSVAAAALLASLAACGYKGPLTQPPPPPPSATLTQPPSAIPPATQPPSIQTPAQQ